MSHSHQAGNVKQGHIQFQETHPPVFVTSNLSNKGLFLKAKKEAGNSCQISADDYCKLLTLEEGRVGTELIMDLPVSVFILYWWSYFHLVRIYSRDDSVSGHGGRCPGL